MAEYIEREALLKKMKILHKKINLIECVNSMPAADVAPVVHGKWMNANSRPKTYERRCTACGGRAYFCGMGCSYKFCPNCGAIMDEVSE